MIASLPARAARAPVTSVLAYCVVAILGTGCASQPSRQRGPILRSGSPESVGFAPARLARIDSALADWVAQGEIPGAVGFVARRGVIVYHQGVGYENVEQKTPLARDAIFRIASMTKALTSTAAMLLYEEGTFALDDPVSKWIPAYQRQQVLDRFDERTGSYTTVPAERDITVRDLLTHTAGLTYPYWNTPWQRIYGRRGLDPNHTFGVDLEGGDLAGAMDSLAAAPLKHQPGKGFTYGFGVDLLGRLVEVWSGQSLDQFLRQRLFDPLGMNDTWFTLPAEKATRLVGLYRADSVTPLARRDWLLFPTGDSLPLDFPLRRSRYFGGGGGLSSTALDYAIFLQMLANGGEYNGVRLLAPSTVRLMTTNQIGDLDADQFGTKFGLGFSLATDETAGRSPAAIGTYGWAGALSTIYWVDPANELIILLYRQMWGVPPGSVDERFRALVYQALLGDGRSDGQ